MQRVIVYSHEDEYLFDMTEREVYELRKHEEVNGEHYLLITTTRILQKEQRILTNDRMGKWYEWVVATEDQGHADGTSMLGTYMAVWSMQHDLQVSRISSILTDKSARDAIAAVTAGTTRWGIGTIGVSKTASASLYQTIAWAALATVVETWGGEVDAEIDVSLNKIVSRNVALLGQVGTQDVTRRFDYGHDLLGIGRVVGSDPFPCRIVPRGKGEETGNGYGRKITIESVNGGLDYLENTSVTNLVRLPDGNGGYEYPTVYADNPDIESPSDLKAWGLTVLESLTSPKVTYTADVMQLAKAGMDVHGIALGDVVHCVDRKFSPEGLRVDGRVVELDENLLDPSDTTVVIGSIRRSIVASTLASIGSTVNDIVASGAATLSDAYVASILNRINDEANTTGGYFYYVVGDGVRTYDVAVSDPAVGTEASKVVEIKGGNIRIANTKTQAGDWEWKTMLQSGYVNSEVLRAIGSGSGGIAEVTANGLMVYIGPDLMASFLADAVRFYDGTGTTAADVTALFGSSGARIGSTSSANITIGSDEASINDGAGNSVFKAALSGMTITTRDGESTRPGVEFSSPGMSGSGTTSSITLLPSSGFDGDTTYLKWLNGWDLDVSVRDMLYVNRNGSQVIVINGNGISLERPVYSRKTHTIDSHSVVTTTTAIEDGLAVNVATGGTGIYVQSLEGSNLGYLRSYAGTGATRPRGLQIVGTTDESANVNGLYLTVDSSGTRHVSVSERAPWLEGLGLSGVGTVVTENPSAVNVSSSSYTTLGSIALDPGVWDIAISTTFADNANGRRAVYFGTDSTATSVNVSQLGSATMAPASAGGTTKYSTSQIAVVGSGGATYYCRAWQNSGSTLSCQCYLQAVRIK